MMTTKTLYLDAKENGANLMFWRISLDKSVSTPLFVSCKPLSFGKPSTSYNRPLFHSLLGLVFIN